MELADLSGVSGTPTFFVNGRRHYGAYDIASLSAAVRAARQRAALQGRPAGWSPDWVREPVGGYATITSGRYSRMSASSRRTTGSPSC